MADTPEHLSRTLWVGVVFVFLFLGLAGLLSLAEMKHERLSLQVIGAIPDFILTNQDGQAASLANLTNHVWIADLVFTRCAGPCPRMTAQMKSLESLLPQDSDARLVTLTTDPGFDSPEILKRYGQRFGADFSRWMFLTGLPSQATALAMNGLRLGSTPVASADQKNAADLFIHSTIIVIVDKHARLRGFFETGGEGVDWENSVRPNVLAAIRQLEQEP